MSSPPTSHDLQRRSRLAFWSITAFLVVALLLSVLAVAIPAYRQHLLIVKLRGRGMYFDIAPGGPKWAQDWLSDAARESLSQRIRFGPIADDGRPIPLEGGELWAIGRMPGLRELRLPDQHLSDDSLVLLQRAPQLESLDPDNNASVGDAGLRHLSGLVLLCNLGLDQSAVTDAGLAHLAQLNRLEYLRLGGTEISDRGLAALRKLERLQSLALDNTQITDAGVGELEKLPALESLSLNGTKIGDAGARELSRLLQLKSLSLADTQITDEGIASLAGLVNLQYFNVSHTPLTDQGLAELTALPQLKYLRIAKTKTTDAGIAHFKRMKSLKELDLEGTAITRPGMERLQKSLPNLRITRAP